MQLEVPKASVRVTANSGEGLISTKSMKPESEVFGFGLNSFQEINLPHVLV